MDRVCQCGKEKKSTPRSQHGLLWGCHRKEGAAISSPQEPHFLQAFPTGWEEVWENLTVWKMTHGTDCIAAPAGLQGSDTTAIARGV